MRTTKLVQKGPRFGFGWLRNGGGLQMATYAGNCDRKACAKPFTTTAPKQKYCCKQCQRIEARARRKAQANAN